MGFFSLFLMQSFCHLSLIGSFQQVQQVSICRLGDTDSATQNSTGFGGFLRFLGLGIFFVFLFKL